MPTVVKGDGSTEKFEPKKLERSLMYAGATGELAARIVFDISHTIKDGSTTAEIYRNAFRMLHKKERILAARYSMRRAILELGPTGYPFEDYVAELMRAQGYTATTRVIVPGRCAEHEVDIIMEKDGRVIGAELKFHNESGFKTDLKTALYVKARFEDIGPSHIHEGWLVTNTKFTDNVIHYAGCAGLTLIGWNFPRGRGLAAMINTTKLYPVTVLTDISKAEKERLLASGVPLCKIIAEQPDVLKKADIPLSKHGRVISQSAALCGIE